MTDKSQVNEPRAFTADEMRERMMHKLVSTAKYWLEEPRTPKTEDKIAGLVFSILVMFDGGTDLPALAIVPTPHPSDEASRKEQGDNWWLDQGEQMDEVVSINGTQLHEEWYDYWKKRNVDVVGSKESDV